MTQRMVATLIGLSLVVAGFHGMFTHFFIARYITLTWVGCMIVLAADLLDHTAMVLVPHLTQKFERQILPETIVAFGWGLLGVILMILGATIGGWVCLILNMITITLRAR